jgi:ABC-type uncharacterized transport system auxiliary subunit
MTMAYRKDKLMHRALLAVPLALLLAVCLCNCGAPRPIKYYSVQVSATPPRPAHTYPVDILVGRITGPAILQASPIVYRTGTNEMGTYQHQRWADPPVDMIRANLTRLLRNSGDYRSVGVLGNTASEEYVIRGRLYDFTEVDGASMSGLVTIEFELYDRKTAKILWSHFYSQMEPVQGKEIANVVQALDRNLDRGLKEVLAGLGQYFAANPPLKS